MLEKKLVNVEELLVHGIGLSLVDKTSVVILGNADNADMRWLYGGRRMPDKKQWYGIFRKERKEITEEGCCWPERACGARLEGHKT